MPRSFARPWNGTRLAIDWLANADSNTESHTLLSESGPQSFPALNTRTGLRKGRIAFQGTSSSPAVLRSRFTARNNIAYWSRTGAKGSNGSARNSQIGRAHV